MKIITALPKDELPGLTFLRGFAAVSIVAYHIPWRVGLSEDQAPATISWLFSLDVGVGLFFALSAFLLSRQLALASNAKQERFRTLLGFVINRFARIYPLYMLVVIASFVIDERTYTGWGLVNLNSHLFMLQNYFYQGQIWQINPVLWAVAVEFQFYLVLVIAYFVSWSIQNQKIRAFTPAGLLVGLYAMGSEIYPWLLENTALLLPRPLLGRENWQLLEAWSLLHFLPWFIPGVLAGSLFAKLGDKALSVSSAWDVAFWCSLACASYITFGNDEGEWRGSLNLKSALLIASITLLVTLIPRTRLADALDRSALLQSIGSYSFGIYLFHFSIQKIIASQIIQFVGETEIAVLVVFIVSLGSSYIFAALSFHIWEWPARTLIRRTVSFLR